jgi:membrane-bound lytic murein transglycosylase B
MQSRLTGLVAVGLATVTLAASALTLAARHHATGESRPAGRGNTVTRGVTPADWPNSSLQPFRVAARRPAASAPVRRLPKVHLAQLSVGGIPPVALRAYQRAAQHQQRTDPGCGVRWWLLAGIGWIESDHARSGGSFVSGWDGVARPPILGPELNGTRGFKAIRDTDHGVLDGDSRWDRAVGPMQFLPSSWVRWGPRRRDGRPDNPQDVRAAAAAAAGYLCAGGRDLGSAHAMAVAVYSYNHSFDYVRLVLTVAARYAGMTADQLGVNLLPTDRALKHRRHHSGRRHQRARPTSSATVDAAASSRAPATGTASPTASPSRPSPSPSPSQRPLPLPTLAPTPLR